ncbi:MAG: hypothetical protein ACRC33_14425, partial [Gemmataceae bacterium]
ITAGVIGGAVMLSMGILGMIFIGLFHRHWDEADNPVRTVRMIGGALGCTGLGAIVLVRALFFGQED